MAAWLAQRKHSGRRQQLSLTRWCAAGWQKKTQQKRGNQPETAAGMVAGGDANSWWLAKGESVRLVREHRRRRIW